MEVLGAQRFAPKPMAKCPTNTRFLLSRHGTTEPLGRIVGNPEAGQKGFLEGAGDKAKQIQEDVLGKNGTADEPWRVAWNDGITDALAGNQGLRWGKKLAYFGSKETGCNCASPGEYREIEGHVQLLTGNAKELRVTPCCQSSGKDKRRSDQQLRS